MPKVTTIKKKARSTCGLKKSRDVLVVNTKENVGDQATSSEPPPKGPEGEAGPNWCKCGLCREMPTPKERKCCSKAANRGCITQSPEFQLVVLHRAVLQVQINMRNDMAFLDEDREDAALRHAAYRQYIYWNHGRTGKFNRVVIPSCSVWATRDAYPSPNNQYTGFKEAQRL